jgi:thiol-disulfide isomerase/thioredoxin
MDRNTIMKHIRTVFFAGIAATIFSTLGCEKGSVVATQPSNVPGAAASPPEQPSQPETKQPSTSGVAETPEKPSSSNSAGNSSPQSQENPVPADSKQPPTEPAEPPNNNDKQPAAAPTQPPNENDRQGEILGPRNPFIHRVNAPDFPKDMEWLNVAGPIRKQDLKGKFVILDFWTYCCINCMHILPELKKLEKAYPNELVVIGVHSAKFETEKGTKNIEEAILRYEIEHPVVNDAEHEIWDRFAVSSWPTAFMIDPEGQAVWRRSGEFKFEEVDEILKIAIPYYRGQKTLDETPIRFELASQKQRSTPLRFPGKVLADEPSGRLFISDSNHNRIIMASLDGKLLATIGSGAIGRGDGDFATATFDHPQGVALQGEVLYVADTENHMLRKIDLVARSVTTVAGTGEQGKGWPGIDKLAAGDEPPDRWIGKPRDTELNSPWDLWIHKNDLYIAMAGPHQIWKMPLDESEIGPYAGNGREDIVDGPLLPRLPYELNYASFAQPSGLSSDGEWLYVADSEGSSIRAVPFDPIKEVRTVVGTADLPFNRLFHFGDKDGARDEVLLQHCLAVAYVSGQLYVTDTYNNKIKVVDPKTGSAKTLAGTGKPGYDDATGEFDEPAGITWAKGLLYVADTNNHQIRTVDPATGKVGTLTISGLQAPQPRESARKPDFSRAQKVTLGELKSSPKDGKITLSVSLALPKNWKMNPEAPMRYWVEADGDQGPVDRAGLGEKKVEPPSAEFTVPVPVSGTGRDSLRVSLVYYYCQESGEGLCKVGNVVWEVPIAIGNDQSPSQIPLKFQVKE